MKNSKIARESALNSCRSINRITGLNLKLAQRADKKIELFCEHGRSLETWNCWEEAKNCLWTSFLVVDASCLKNVLLADSTAIERKLTAAEKKLVLTTKTLESVKADRDHYFKTAVMFARTVDIDSEIS